MWGHNGQTFHNNTFVLWNTIHADFLRKIISKACMEYTKPEQFRGPHQHMRSTLRLPKLMRSMCRYVGRILYHKLGVFAIGISIKATWLMLGMNDVRIMGLAARSADKYAFTQALKSGAIKNQNDKLHYVNFYFKME